MDLAHPISAVVPSVSGVVLDVLLSDHRALTGRLIAKFSDGRASQKAVSVALKKLAEEGLVVAEASEHAHRYRINDDHLATPALRMLHEMRRTLYGAVTSLVQGWVLQPTGAWVVGPLSEQYQVFRPDLEVLLIPPPEAVDDPSRWAQQVGELLERTHAWTGRACTVTERTLDYLRSSERLYDGMRATLRSNSVPLVPFDWDAVSLTGALWPATWVGAWDGACGGPDGGLGSS